MPKLIEEVRETRAIELEKRELEKHAREEKEREEERQRWKVIEDAKEELKKEKDLINEEKEIFRSAQIQYLKDKEDFDKLVKKNDEDYAAKLDKLTVE